MADQVPFGHEDRYLLRRLMKPGGMGYVFDAVDSALTRRRVALKIPVRREDDSVSREVRERFRNEIRALTYLRHPSINPVVDHGEWSDWVYFTMPFLAGGTLDARLRRSPRPEIEQVALWVAEVARAMEYAHAIGVYHRDLKPANLIFETKRDEARLLVNDFGLALIHGDTRITQDGTILGTRAYMSPEQMAGTVRSHGARSDIYSLGVIFYEALTGRVPFLETGEALRASVLRDEPPRPKTLRAEIPEPLEEICLKAMARAPQQRYKSMGELAGAIEAHLQRPPRPDVSVAPAGEPASGPHVTRRGLHQIAMSQVPPGTFLMGSPDSDDERPTRRVGLKTPFLMGVYPVTQSLYRAIVGSLPLSRFNGNDKHPVDSVSWYEAIHFCNRLSVADGLQPYYEIQRNGQVKHRGGSGYRLPTEAEWEYACRAGSTTVYFFGDDASRLGEFAWYHDNSSGSTHPVGELSGNGFGLHDILGNVWEWCWDWYAPYPARGAPDTEIELNPVGPRRGDERTLRGGSFQASHLHLRSSQRLGCDPELGVYYIGFRLACSLGS
jgi:formylglycine-generating enzyme required for sulfatase activity/tRNA A-37 threonylcarbamoyl transferase component Bud32